MIHVVANKYGVPGIPVVSRGFLCPGDSCGTRRRAERVIWWRRSERDVQLSMVSREP
jgi:hypothetical protein